MFHEIKILFPTSGTSTPPLESPGKYQLYNLSKLFVPTDHMTRDRRSAEASGVDEYHRASSATTLRFQKTEPSSEELSPSSLDEIYLRPDQVKFLRSQIDKYFLIGYDCSKPREVSAVFSFIDDPCEQRLGEREEVGVVQTSTYQILQYKDERTLTATHCTLWKSQSKFFCGNAHRATPFPSMSYNERVTLLTGAECQTLATSGKSVDTFRRNHTIAQNQEYTLSYYTHGSTSPYSDWTGTQIICNGDRLKVQNQEVDEMVVYVTDKILYRPEKIIQREDESIIAFYDNVRPPCGINDGHSQSPSSTYYW